MNSIDHLTREQVILAVKQSAQYTTKLDRILRRIPMHEKGSVQPATLDEIQECMDRGANLAQITSNTIQALTHPMHADVFKALSVGLKDMEDDHQKSFWISVIRHCSIKSLAVLFSNTSVPPDVDFALSAAVEVVGAKTADKARLLLDMGILSKAAAYNRDEYFLSSIKSSEVLAIFVEAGFKNTCKNMVASSILRTEKNSPPRRKHNTYPSDFDLMRTFLELGTPVKDELLKDMNLWNALVNRGSPYTYHRENQVRCVKLLQKFYDNVELVGTPTLPGMLILLDAGFSPDTVLSCYKVPWKDHSIELFERNENQSENTDPVLFQSITSLLIEAQDKGLDIDQLWHKSMSNNRPFLYAFASAGVAVTIDKYPLPPEVVALGEQNRLIKNTPQANSKKRGIRL